MPYGIAIVGLNGSGKTTLLKLCAGILTPTHGSITVCGKPVGPESKAIVSYLPDRTYLGNRQTVAEQLQMFEEFYADFDRDRAQAMLTSLGIRPEMRFGTLSKGTKEKVQLVLVMSRRAKLYLLDEPIGLKRILTGKQLWVAGALGAIAHSVGQMIAAIWISGTPGLIVYLPVMVVCSIVTGVFTGLCAQVLLNRGEKFWKTFLK